MQKSLCVTPNNRKQDRYFIFPIQKKHRPLINHANLVILQHRLKNTQTNKPHYIILALGLLDIFRVLTYCQGDVFLPPTRHSLDSISVWQNGSSKLKINFLAFAFVSQWDRECKCGKCSFGAVWVSNLNRAQQHKDCGVLIGRHL